MRTAAALALLTLAGCYYDRPNPWRTSGDVADLQAKTEADYALLVNATFQPPQASPPRLYDADLEAFRDTVLVSASPATLVDLRTQSAAKLAWLQARQADLLKQAEIERRDQLREVNDQIRVEWVRGKMIEGRLEAIGQR
jgi:hypothetical protein